MENIYHFQLELFLAPLFLSGLILGLKGWQREMFNRKKRAVEHVEAQKLESEEEARRKRIANARLPAGIVQVFTQREARKLYAELLGYYMFVGVGTFGINQTVRTLKIMYMSGLEQLVGSILIIENNAALRNQFPKSIPSVFHNRVVYGFSPSFTGGFANKPTAEVLQFQNKWGGKIIEAAENVAYFHERVTKNAPSQILFFLSQGGSIPTGLPAIQTLSDKFRHAQIVGFTSLSEHIFNRQKFAEVKEPYEKAGVAGWVVSDKLSRDWVNADFFMAALVVAPAAAQLQDDQTTQLNNIFTLAFGNSPGSMLVYQYIHTTVVAYPWMVEGELLGYMVNAQSAMDKLIEARQDIEGGKGRLSAKMPIGQPGASIFDLIMMSFGMDIRHNRDDLQNLRDDIMTGNGLRLAHLEKNGGREQAPNFHYGLANYEEVYGSLATEVDEAKSMLPILVARLSAVRNGDTGIEELIKVPDDLLPAHITPTLPSSAEEVEEGQFEVIEEETDEDTTPTTTESDRATPRRGRPRKNV